MKHSPEASAGNGTLKSETEPTDNTPSGRGGVGDFDTISIRKIGAVAVQAAVWFLVTFGSTWAAGQDAALAAKSAVGVVCGWLLGHLQRTGGFAPTLEGLKK